MNTFYTGIIEDINDPKMLGRARARVIGVHNPDKVELPTEYLPWAMVCQPVFSAGKDGVGLNHVGFVVGTTVLVTFKDPNTLQEPIIMGTIQGQSSETETDLGYLATNTHTDRTVVKSKRDNVYVSPDPSEQRAWGEPATPYNPQYTKNTVLQTKSGHIIELDDTEGSERLHIYHKSGAFVEIHPSGKLVIKAVDDSFEICRASKYKSVKNDDHSTISGDKIDETLGNVEEYVGGNKTNKINGNLTVNITGNVDVNVAGDYRITCGGNFGVAASRIDLN